MQGEHTLSYQPLYYQPSNVTNVAGYISETYLRHCLLTIKSCLIPKIPLTHCFTQECSLSSDKQFANCKFDHYFAWQLVTQRYNNKWFIAMKHAKHLCQIPQLRKADASSLRELINHMSRHINTLQALSVNVTAQVLMLNYLMLATLGPETSSQPHAQILQQLENLSHFWNQDAEPLSCFRRFKH